MIAEDNFFLFPIYVPDPKAIEYYEFSVINEFLPIAVLAFPFEIA